MTNLDKCIFCENELESHRFTYTEENGERAISDKENEHELNICKCCVIKLQGILKTKQEIKLR